MNKIVNTTELEREFNRLIDLAYDKGRAVGYSQAKEEQAKEEQEPLTVSEKEKDIIKFALDYLHDADLSEYGADNVRVLENLMTKLNLTFVSQLEE